MAARQPPTPTDHASDRWHERATRIPDYEIDAIDDVDLWSAWVDAQPVELPAPYRHGGDEARYHADAGVVLCRRDHAITTVYDVYGPDSDADVRRAVANQFDIDLEEPR